MNISSLVVFRMGKGFVLHNLKLLVVEIESYLGDGLVFVITEFTENRNHVPPREISMRLLEKK